MPAPTTNCSVCGETVLKAQTRHIGEGKRACKSHDGVMGIAEEVHAGQLADLASKRSAKRLSTLVVHQRRDPEPIRTDLHCNICGKSAVKVQDLLFESLVASKELELEGKPATLLDAMLKGDNTIAERVRAKFPGKVGLYVYTQEELGDQWDMVLNKSRRSLREGLRMFGFAGVCTECVASMKLPDKMANLPQPPIETMLMLGDSVDRTLTEIVEKRREQNNDQRAVV